MTDKQIINGVDVRCYSDKKGFCDFCKDDIDGAIGCPYENHCSISVIQHITKSNKK